MGVLYYWRPDNYARDRQFGFGLHLNQNSPRLRDLKPGDHVWAFTRRRTDGFYVLAADLVAIATTTNRPNYRYGRYRVWADPDRSRYFDIDRAPDFEPVLRRLSIQADARVLAQAFQGLAAVRPITPADEELLMRASLYPPTLQVAGIYPEDLFEAALLFGPERARQLRVMDESDERYRGRHEYLYATVDRTRSSLLVEHLHQLYNGRCQVCRIDPGRRYGVPLAQGHHLIWLSMGGDDVLENLALLCPNHHHAVHRARAAFDYEGLVFRFPNGLQEPLRLNLHLPVA
ncbi:MAG: HNH endonuclease signature motif containing protein [Bacillota bacterium]